MILFEILWQVWDDWSMHITSGLRFHHYFIQRKYQAWSDVPLGRTSPGLPYITLVIFYGFLYRILLRQIIIYFTFCIPCTQFSCSTPSSSDFDSCSTVVIKILLILLQVVYSSLGCHIIQCHLSALTVTILQSDTHIWGVYDILSLSLMFGT